ncbi:flagellar hook-associated protein FlgK [Amorphus sp. 3PC139-8]|uniref:flagellar hook-associated protein FlgK n=1 Tax=Amorphus sp. 3PC139-8 TaxID=2735676 RepID=UPI00345DF6B9
MSLSVALNTARSSIQATSTQIATSGKNVAGADDPTYSRKIASKTTTADGSARLVSIGRATDVALYTRMLGATSATTGATARLEGIERLAETVGDPELETSPAAKIGALSSALLEYANTPDDPLFGQNVVTAASDLTRTMNAAAETVLTVRKDADADIAASVDRLNGLLGRFEEMNQAVVAGSGTGRDITQLMDQRDALLSQISEEIGISVVNRGQNNDLVLYTDSGVTLFETRARVVAFTPASILTAGMTGNAVTIDGVPVTGSNASMPLQSGRLVGLTEVRDEVAMTYQRQLDEMARGLVTAFAEADQTAGGAPDLPGLFTFPSATGVPGVVTANLSVVLQVNPAVDPAQGGAVARLRDGINGGVYTYNTGGGASFSVRLRGLVDGLAGNQSFDAGTGLSPVSSLQEFAAGSVSWIEALRAGATRSADYETALLSRASEALSNATGVNLDEEYAIQLQLEQSFGASSRLISVIDDLFKTLLGIVR